MISPDYRDNIKIKTVSKWTDFQSLSQQWNSLLKLSEIDRVYMTHEWFSAWWKAFGKNKQLLILLALQDDELIGIAPLMEQKTFFRGIPVKTIEFMSNNDSPACGFIYKKNHNNVIIAFLNHLVRNIKKWDMLFLKNIANDTHTNQTIETFFKEKKIRYLIKPGLSSPYLKITKKWDEYFKSLSTKRRKTLRNISNRIKRLESPYIKEINNSSFLKDIIKISIKAWKYKEGKAFINRDDRKEFFTRITQLASSRGWLSIWLLYNNSTPIAYEYHLKYNQISVALLSEFNEEYREYSPGAYLDYEIVKFYFNNDIKEYDMGGSEDNYKKKWTNLIREYKNLIVFNNSLHGLFLYTLEAIIVEFLRNIRYKYVATSP